MRAETVAGRFVAALARNTPAFQPAPQQAPSGRFARFLAALARNSPAFGVPVVPRISVVPRQGQPANAHDAPVLEAHEIRPTDAVESPGPASFEDLYQREALRVISLLRALGAPGDLAEDIAQEAFLRALQQWDTIGRTETAGAWVRKVAVRQLGLAQRRARSEAVQPIEPAEELANDARSEIATDVWQALRDLPRRQREVIALRYMAGLTIDEIAEALKIQPSGVRSHLHKAQRQLRLGLVDD